MRGRSKSIITVFVLSQAILAIVWVTFLGCESQAHNEEARLYQQYCGSCHMVPDPAHLPKSIWKNKVLPEMGSRLGLKFVSYNPYNGLSVEETKNVFDLGIYPKKAAISRADWLKITNYVLQRAPDSLSFEENKRVTKKPLTQFGPEPVDLNGKPGGIVSFVGVEEDTQLPLVGDVFGKVWRIEADGTPKFQFRTSSPLVAYTGKFLTEIGNMPPSEFRDGQVTMKSGGSLITIMDSLHRPVYTLASDLDDDGTDELLICEFGHHTGQLTLAKEVCENQYHKTPLLSQPGVVRVAVSDMDKDGRNDIVVLTAQAEEGVFILFQQDSLVFQAEQVVRFPPVYGTSDMKVIDFDGDGSLDIITVQGDNADYSLTTKPYHGVRIFLNDGKNQFDEAFFYPLFGATQVLAYDFDEDGDVDLAVSSFFAAYDKYPEESFVFLENTSKEAIAFDAYTFPESVTGRWMVMERGDFDGDEDEDILLGSFTGMPVGAPLEYLNSWKKSPVDVILLRNKRR